MNEAKEEEKKKSSASKSALPSAASLKKKNKKEKKVVKGATADFAVVAEAEAIPQTTPNVQVETSIKGFFNDSEEEAQTGEP